MSPFSAVRTLAEHWWVVLLRGILAILFGVLAWTRPGLTVAVLVLFFGAYALVDGIFEVIAGLRGKWWGLVFTGVLGIAAGVVTFMWPHITALALLWLIAFWAIVVGIMQISAAIRLRREVQGEWLWIVSGILSVLLGIILIARPGPGALSLIWVIGLFAIMWGFLLCILAFKLKGIGSRAALATTAP